MTLINNLRGGHCFGSSKTRRIRCGKIAMFKLGHRGFDGSVRQCMFPQCICQNGVDFLRRLALQKKKLMIARAPMLLKSRAPPAMLPFNLCKKKRLAIRHMNRPLFPATNIGSVLHQEVVRAKDLPAPPRMSMKNSNDTIWNRTCDLPACSLVPQPIAPCTL